jgi:hypothetical protein
MAEGSEPVGAEREDIGRMIEWSEDGVWLHYHSLSLGRGMHKLVCYFLQFKVTLLSACVSETFAPVGPLPHG